MDIIFRLAQADDLVQIAQMFKEATSDMRSRGIFQWDDIYPSQEHIKEDIEKAEMYLLARGDEIICTVTVNDEQIEEYKSVRWRYGEEKIAVIHRLCVNPFYQGRGYGKQTMARAEELLKRMGYTAVRLDAFSQNPCALKLYEGLSYERAGEVRFRTGVFFLYEKLL